MLNDRRPSAYVGTYADLYDVFYATKPYAEEALSVLRLIREHAEGSVQTLLDVACGTGGHALAFARAGLHVVGVDVSPDMIDRARSKVPPGLPARFAVQDMRELDVPDRPFDAVTCLFDSIGYVSTTESVRRALGAIRDHLRPGGVFVTEFIHAAAMVREYEPLRVREWDVPGGRIVRTSRTALDVARQLFTVDYHVVSHLKDGTRSEARERHTNRYFSVPEMELILETCGLAPLAAQAGFTGDQPITERTWHILLAARRT